MIKQKEIDSTLAMKHAQAVGGWNIDLEIFKESGRVSRHRQYRVYLPADYSEKKSYPLLMVLHGCRQDHLAIQAITGFDAIADREGAIVVYPFVTTYAGLRSQNCWGWWLSRQRQRGRGEVSDLQRIAEDVEATYSVDASRRHICGLSSGAGMTVASLAAYSDFWTSGASVAGVPFGESISAVRYNSHVPVRRKTVNTLVRMLSRELVTDAPPLLVVQSKSDELVGPRLGANLRDSWVKVSNCEQQASSELANVERGIEWTLQQYCTLTSVHVAHFLIDKLEHGWPGGLPGKFCFPDAPNVSELIWTFFDRTSTT